MQIGNTDIFALLIGLLLSLVGGWIVCGTFMMVLRKISGITKRTDIKTVPPALTGLVERLFFSILVAVQLPGVAPAMIAWIALKMASNWNRDNEDPNGRFHRFAALLTGIISMLFALWGGLIIASGT